MMRLSLVVETDDGRRLRYELDPRSLDLEGRWQAFGMKGGLVIRGGRVTMSVEPLSAAGYLFSRLRGRESAGIEQLKAMATLFSCILGLPVEIRMKGMRVMRVTCPEEGSGERRG